MLCSAWMKRSYQLTIESILPSCIDVIMHATVSSKYNVVVGWWQVNLNANISLQANIRLDISYFNFYVADHQLVEVVCDSCNADPDSWLLARSRIKRGYLSCHRCRRMWLCKVAGFVVIDPNRRRLSSWLLPGKLISG
jgi:hypothetical protein